MCPGSCDVITKELVTTLSLLLFPGITGIAAAYLTSQHCLASIPFPCTITMFDNMFR